ncbi:MAG: phage terminase large subunit, partial [Bacteroidia bacterium]|nr:phage terminase large subunit [Bacteroidia bacterium]
KRDDLIGRLIDTKYNMTHIRLPALYDGLDAYGSPESHQKEIDTPLWDEFGYDYYDEIRRSNEYTWQSLYQGLPISRGNAIFKDVTFYNSLPSEYKVQIGVDLAYSERTKSDYSVAVVIAVANQKYYILDVIRWQKEFNYSIDILQNLYNKYVSKIAMENNGVQKAICDMVESKLGYNRIKRINPTQDKVARATDFSSQWNLGNVLVPNPEIYPNNWLSDYIEEMQSFTGIKDKHDDQVDASVYAFMNKGIELGDMIMI